MKPIQENLDALEGECVSADQMIRSLRVVLDQETGLRRDEEKMSAKCPQKGKELRQGATETTKR